MDLVGLTSGEEFLRDAARKYFEDIFEEPSMHLNSTLHHKLAWRPALRFTVYQHVNVFVEPSESGPYPQIFDLRASDVRRFPEPIAIYSVCPEHMISSTDQQRRDLRRLEADGFGLITVDSNGVGKRSLSTIPLIQIIDQSEFKSEIVGLPKTIRQRVSESFEDYRAQPVNGVKSLSEVVEGLVQKAGTEIIKRGYLSKSQLGNSVANTLDAMHAENRFQSVRGQIGGLRSYIQRYRNLSHHWPRTKKGAYKKYSDCRHAFLEGIKQIHEFRQAMKNVGLSGNLPR